MNEDIERSIINRLRSIGSPLSSVYFGDLKLLEEPMRVIIESGDNRLITYGFVLSHPIFGKFPQQIHTLLREALGFTIIRKNALLLPKIIKYLEK